MNKILIPTDFSIEAKYAISIALKLIEKFSGDITLLHVVNTPADMLTDKNGIVIDDNEVDFTSYKTSLIEAKDKMVAFKKELPENVGAEVLEGKLNDTIIKYIEKRGFDLVVMGTKGAEGIREILHGSETEIIVRRSPVPVLSLMHSDEVFQLKNILFINDFKRVTIENLDILKAIISAFNAELHLLKISSDDESDLLIEKNMQDFINLNSLKNASMHIFKDRDVEDGIVHFLQKHEIDLLTIGTHSHKGFKPWSKSSVTESLVKHLHKPILSFHLNN
ncbi:MAG: universal stress protein [Bacteroidota bacterium]